MSVDVRWQMVTCKGCGKHYQCTPQQDYYEATTLDDGVCETCLLMDAGVHPDKIVTACPALCGRVTEDVDGGLCAACQVAAA